MQGIINENDKPITLETLALKSETNEILLLQRTREFRNSTAQMLQKDQQQNKMQIIVIPCFVLN